MATSTNDLPVNGLSDNLKVLLNTYLETNEITAYHVFWKSVTMKIKLTEVRNGDTETNGEIQVQASYGKKSHSHYKWLERMYLDKVLKWKLNDVT